jgi:hypothetical protein
MHPQGWGLGGFLSQASPASDRGAWANLGNEFRRKVVARGSVVDPARRANMHHASPPRNRGAWHGRADCPRCTASESRHGDWGRHGDLPFPASLLLPHLALAATVGVLLDRMAGDWLTGVPD